MRIMAADRDSGRPMDDLGTGNFPLFRLRVTTKSGRMGHPSGSYVIVVKR